MRTRLNITIRCNLRFCLPSPFSSGFPIKILYEFLLPLVCATSPSRLILLNLVFETYLVTSRNQGGCERRTRLPDTRVASSIFSKQLLTADSAVRFKTCVRYLELQNVNCQIRIFITFTVYCKLSHVNIAISFSIMGSGYILFLNRRVGTLIMANIYLQLIQNRYMFRSFTVLQCSHQHCVQPVASDVEVVGYLQQRLLC